MPTEPLIYYLGGLEVTIRANEEDRAWLAALFRANANPFKALLGMGYVPKDTK